MRLFFSLLFLLLLGPIFFISGVVLLLEGPDGVGPLPFEEVADPDGGAVIGVAVEGRLLRLGSPDLHRVGDRMLFPLVDVDFAGSSGSLPAVPVIARVPASDVPGELFQRPRSIADLRLVTEPMEFVGQRRRRRHVQGELARTLFPGDPDPAERDVIMLDTTKEPPGLVPSIVMTVVGALFLLFGLKMFRTWRRRRAEARRVSARMPAGASSSAFGEGCGKVAGGLVALVIGIGVVAAKVGSKAAPALDNVARTAARGADEAAGAAASGAAKAADAAGEAARAAGEFALSNASTLKTAYELQQELGRPPTGTLRGSYTVTRTRETYRRVDVATFELARMANTFEMERGGTSESGTDRDLPERARGEFERLRFERSDRGTTDVHVVSGQAGPGGWVETFTFSAPVEFVDGDWDALESGGRAVLRLAEGAPRLYGQRQAALLERMATATLSEEGFVAGRVDATAREVPRFTYEVEGDGLEIDCAEPLSFGLKVTYWR